MDIKNIKTFDHPVTVEGVEFNLKMEFGHLVMGGKTWNTIFGICARYFLSAIKAVQDSGRIADRTEAIERDRDLKGATDHHTLAVNHNREISARFMKAAEEEAKKACEQYCTKNNLQAYPGQFVSGEDEFYYEMRCSDENASAESNKNNNSNGGNESDRDGDRRFKNDRWYGDNEDGRYYDGDGDGDDWNAGYHHRF